jgi:ribosomal-protein-alanine N-acetyltransferase
MPIPSFDPLPILETERLRLREWRESDAAEVFFLRSDPRIQKYLGRPPAASIDDAIAHIRMIIDGTANGKWVSWIITMKGEDICLGDIGFWNYHETKPQAEIGYQLHPDYQRKGLMSEAMAKVLDFGLNEMGLKLISAHLHRENDRSVNLLQRFMFIHDETIVDEDEPFMETWALKS